MGNNNFLYIERKWKWFGFVIRIPPRCLPGPSTSNSGETQNTLEAITYQAWECLGRKPSGLVNCACYHVRSTKCLDRWIISVTFWCDLFYDTKVSLGLATKGPSSGLGKHLDQNKFFVQVGWGDLRHHVKRNNDCQYRNGEQTAITCVKSSLLLSHLHILPAHTLSLYKNIIWLPPLLLTQLGRLKSLSFEHQHVVMRWLLLLLTVSWH